MSLLFGGATSDVVAGTNFGTDPTVFTLIQWVYPTSFTNSRYYFTKNGAALFAVQTAAAGDAARLRLTVDYTTADMVVLAATTLATNTWQFIAITGNHTTSAPRAFIGSLTAAPAEVSYTTQTTPTGTRVTDGGAAYLVGNNAGAISTFQGRIAFFHFINGTVLTPDQIKAQWLRPSRHANSKVILHLGYNGTGTQRDYSGLANTGAVTGASVAPHVPVTRFF